MAILEFVIAVIVCSITFCAYKVYKLQTYWSSRGVPHIKPKLLVGNIVENGKKPFFWHYRQVYEKLKDRKAPFVGFHFFLMPFAFIMDLDLVKNILIKDFNNFVDRGMYVNEKDDPLSGHLFSLDGERWRTMRHKLTTTFTSGKMKFMFPTVVEVSKQFSEAFATIVAEDPIVEIKDLLSRFTTDVIGRCAFGIECNSLKDPSAEFRTKGRQFFTDRRHNFIVQTLMIAFPKFAQKLGMKIIPDHVHDFFMGMVKETVKYREENNIVKNDFLNLLLELKNNNETSLTIEEMAAQCFVFFVAGFETSSSTMGFCLYELALNQDIQEKVRTEILETLENHNGEFTYECMQDMKYLDQCVQETLRKHSVLPHLSRVALKDYKVENSNMVIEKGTICFIPVDAIMHDPENYPEPEVFNPDRFLPENIKDRPSIAFLPFGDGPRNCIGLRFGKMQTYIGLVALLSKFKFSLSGKTVMPLQYEESNILRSIKDGLFLKVEHIS